jgi:alpha 1,2-mannosyltransferase
VSTNLYSFSQLSLKTSVDLSFSTSTAAPVGHSHSVPNQQQQQCRPNAIVYLAQKKHSSYVGRDSFGLLLQSLDLLFLNYLDTHWKTASVLIFHTGDFNDTDRQFLQQRQAPHTNGTILLYNLWNTSYWQLPASLKNDDPSLWFLTDYSVGYRHMMRWYALQLYEWLDHESPCHYEYVMRMDEESLLLSPIRYDLFEYMQTHNFYYAFRQCSYELHHLKPYWREYKNETGPTDIQPVPFLVQNYCGPYNNFFILHVQNFIRHPPTYRWLQWMDRSGYIYRRRVNDLLIHAAALHAFTPPQHVHRFLDFTYQHVTYHDECPLWGALSGGYDDVLAHQHVEEFWKIHVLDAHCETLTDKPQYAPRKAKVTLRHLSPSFQHNVPSHVKALPQVAAGYVDLEDVGPRSG